MVAHMLFTKLMDALFSSYTNLGTRVPKNDATITRKKDDATVKKPPIDRFWSKQWSELGISNFIEFGKEVPNKYIIRTELNELNSKIGQW